MNFRKPLAFYDLETTGLDTAKDRIVSIFILKVMPDKTEVEFERLINPEMSIPSFATAVNGITDDMVKDCPKFKDVAVDVYDFMRDCYIIGFNNNSYDNPLLQEEFCRCGIDFPDAEQVHSIDVCYIFKHFEKRDLASAHRYYCGSDYTDKHSSRADTLATMRVFFKQIEKYPELKGKKIGELAKFCNPNNRAEWTEKILKGKRGDYVFNFGQEKGKKVEHNIRFAEWILTRDFPLYFLKLIERIRKQILEK